MLKTGGLSNLFLISSNAFCCSSPQMNGLPFLVSSYVGLSNFCSSGQNMLTKFTTPVKLLQPFWFVGVLNFGLLPTYFARVSHILACLNENGVPHIL